MTLTHCPKNNLNLFIKTEPHTVRADDTVCVWLMGQIYSNEYCTYSTVLYSTVLYVYKCQRCSIASAPAVLGMVFMRRFGLYLGQCRK